jgi:hypothetical protein
VCADGPPFVPVVVVDVLGIDVDDGSGLGVVEPAS